MQTYLLTLLKHANLPFNFSKTCKLTFYLLKNAHLPFYAHLPFFAHLPFSFLEELNTLD